MTPEAYEKLMKSLRSEIAQVEDEANRQEQLARLQEIASLYEGPDKLISSKELYDELKQNPPQPGVLSGFNGLDSILGGFTSQQLIVLSGITKHGKTSFAIELTSRMTELQPLLLPFEESATELVLKFMERGQEPPHFFTPKSIKEQTVVWCEQKIVEAKAKYGSKIIFIDHLGFITPHSRDNEAIEIGRVMRALKGLAKKWDIIIVLLCHLTKTQLDKHPTLEDLRGSAAIGQEADTVLFIWRETKKNGKTGEVQITNNTNISVQANRRTGRTGNVKLVFTNGKYLEMDWRNDGSTYAVDSDPSQSEW